MPHDNVLRRQRGTAKRLRRELTDAERKVWHLLRGHRFEGIGFRRQMPMGSYIVDFVAHRMRLVIEIDGSQHATAAAIETDRVHDAWLQSRGYTVLRFGNTDVLENIDGVADAILRALPPPSESA